MRAASAAVRPHARRELKYDLGYELLLGFQFALARERELKFAGTRTADYQDGLPSREGGCRILSDRCARGAA